MKIIDGHIHLGRWDNPDFFGRKLELAELVESYEKWGIGGGLVMPTDQAKNQETLDQLKSRSGKYKFLPWIKPGNKATLGFCRENLKNISGLKFHPSLDKTKLTDPGYKDFIKFADDNKLPIAVHCGRWEEIAGSKFPFKVASEFPELRIILSHMGGDTPKLAFKAIETIKNSKLKNVYLDTAGFREYWVIEKGVSLIGAGKFLFASDFPLGHPSAAIELIKHLKISDEEKEMILGRNTSGLFGFGE